MTDKIERNDNGEILVNLKKALEAAPGGWESPMERYNGGWCKTVTALDKSRDNGYSLVGEFTKKECSMAYQRPGLYLDCDIGGSRKNQRKYYTLFELKDDGTVSILKTLEGSTDWAVKLWPSVEQWFADQQAAASAEINWDEPRPHDKTEAEVIEQIRELIEDRNLTRALISLRSAAIDAGISTETLRAAAEAILINQEPQSVSE